MQEIGAPSLVWRVRESVFFSLSLSFPRVTRVAVDPRPRISGDESPVSRVESENKKRKKKKRFANKIFV